MTGRLLKTLLLALIAILFLDIMQVQADGIVKVETKEFKTVEEQINEQQINETPKKSLYVIEEINYREIIKSKSIMIKHDSHLLVINSKNISDDEMEEMKSADSLYILGELQENMDSIQELPNFRHNITDENMYELLPFIAKENPDKDIVIVNGDSISDYLTATQISAFDNKNILLVNDELSYAVKEYLRANGQDKEITFIEGELSIQDDIKEEILEVAGNERYIETKTTLTKRAKKEREKREINIPNVEVNPMSKHILKNKTLNLLLKSHIELNKLAYNETKVLAFQKENDNTLTFISLIDSYEDKDELLINENNKDENDYHLTLTYIKAVDLLDEIENDDVRELIFYENISKNVMNDLIEENDEDEYRVSLIKEAGYDYEAMKDEIDQAKEETKIENFIVSALKMEGWEYSQPRRMEHGFADCSSLVLIAMLDSQLTHDDTNLTTWTIHLDDRFYEVPMSEIQRGDILWYEGHMEIYMGGETTFGAFRPGVPAGYATNIERFDKAYRIVIE